MSRGAPKTMFPELVVGRDLGTSTLGTIITSCMGAEGAGDSKIWIGGATATCFGATFPDGMIITSGKGSALIFSWGAAFHPGSTLGGAAFTISAMVNLPREMATAHCS